MRSVTAIARRSPGISNMSRTLPAKRCRVGDSGIASIVWCRAARINSDCNIMATFPSAYRDQRIARDGALLPRIDNKGIDIDLGDLRMRCRKPAEPRRNFCNRTEIECGRASE